MRLAGHGLPQMKGSSKGDLYATVSVDIAKELSPEQKKLVKKLAATGM